MLMWVLLLTVVHCVTCDSRPLQSLALFVGYARSAHTVVGAILDAHPNIAIVHEGSIVERVHLYPTKASLVDFIVNRAAQQDARGRWQTGWSYAIDGAWQGRQKTPLLIVGDKKGGATSALLASDWHGTLARFEHLRAMVGGHLKFIHVVRNVYDNIATMILFNEVRSNVKAYHQIRLDLTPRPWKQQYDVFVRRYLDLADANIRLSNAVHAMANASFLHVNGWLLLSEPFRVLQDICNFLNVPYDGQWANASAAKLFAEPFSSRDHFIWPRKTVELLKSSLPMQPFSDLMQFPSKIVE